MKLDRPLCCLLYHVYLYCMETRQMPIAAILGRGNRPQETTGVTHKVFAVLPEFSGAKSDL